MESERRDEGSVARQACLLIYDGECQLCVSAKAKFERLVVRQAGADVRFLPYQSEEAMKALGSDYRPGRPAMAFFIQPSGQVHRGLDAFLPLVPNLPGGKLLLWCLRFPFAKWLVQRGYRIIARHRYRWFGEAESTSLQA
jgi:predicted DCC family thiol-disulfide oxidoreductase YuxK